MNTYCAKIKWIVQLIALYAVVPLASYGLSGTCSVNGQNPGYVAVAAGVSDVAVTVSWSASGTSNVAIYIGAATGSSATLFASGGASGSATTGAWVTNGMTFYCEDASSRTVFSQVQVIFKYPTMSANPNPILLAAGASGGTTTISWSAYGHSTVGIHVGSASGTLFTQGGTTGSATTGNWVTNGMVFVLVDASTNATIDTLTVNTVTASLTANPNPTLIPYGASGGTTTLSLNAPGDSNVQLHQGSVSGPVVFSGGPSGSVTVSNVANGTTFYLMDVASGNTLQSVVVSASMASLSASPNPIIAPLNGTSGSTTISYNALSDSNVNLFSGSPNGTKVASGGPTNSVTVTASNGTTYYLVDGNTGNTLQELTVNVQNPSLTAQPNPIMVSPGVTSGSTTLSFNAPGYTNAQVHVGSAAGTVLFTGGPTGSNISSGSVTDGTTIYLVDGNSGTTLQTLLLNVTQTPYASSQDFIWLGPQVIAIENGNGP